MSDSDLTDPRADLAYVRAMTERAANAPLLGGRYLVFWGVLLTCAYLAHFSIASGLLGAPGFIPFIWIAFGVIGGLGMAVLSRGMARKPGQSAIGNTVERQVWRGAGLGIFLFVAGVVAAVSLRGGSYMLFDLIAAVALALYGAAFLATAAASGHGWMRAPAWMSFAAAAIVPLLAGSATLYLWLAVVVVLVGVLPGVRLLRAEPPALDEAGDG
ncbi:MAG: hypothetical protein ACFE0P_14090 [Oceanicaulis sp.]